MIIMIAARNNVGYDVYEGLFVINAGHHRGGGLWNCHIVMAAGCCAGIIKCYGRVSYRHYHDGRHGYS